jgi:hypothetical protein
LLYFVTVVGVFCAFFRVLSFLITIYPYQAIDARPVEVIQCRQAYVLDDLSNGEYYEFPGPTATNLALPPGYKVTSSKIICTCRGKFAQCDSEYSISVIVTMVAIESICLQLIWTTGNSRTWWLLYGCRRSKWYRYKIIPTLFYLYHDVTLCICWG